VATHTQTYRAELVRCQLLDVALDCSHHRALGLCGAVHQQALHLRGERQGQACRAAARTTHTATVTHQLVTVLRHAQLQNVRRQLLVQPT
jgi:hypothetical protein